MSTNKFVIGKSQRFWRCERTVYENDRSIGSIEVNWLRIGKMLVKGKEFTIGGELIYSAGKPLIDFRQQSIGLLGPRRYLIEDLTTNRFFDLRHSRLFLTEEHYELENSSPSCVLGYQAGSVTVELLDDVEPHVALFFGWYNLYLE